MANIKLWGTTYNNVEGVELPVEGGGTVVLYERTLESKNVSYTPTETAQSDTVAPSTGYDGLSQVSVSVGAIASTYVGSGITRRTASDLTATGATVTVPAGYYENQATKAVASGTAGTPTASKGTVSNHAVTVTPSVTNTAGYISGGTKTGTGVSVAASELVSGTLSITSNGTGIDVTNYQKVDVNVSGGGGGTNLKNYVIRPDAALVQTWSYDTLAVQGQGITLPSYSTSAQTLKTNASNTATLDRAAYTYFIVYRMLTIPTYNTTTKSAARFDYHAAIDVFEITRIAANTIQSVDGTKKHTSALDRVSSAVLNGTSVYWSSSTTLKAAGPQNYGCYQTHSAPTASGNTLTIPMPTFYMRGSTTYLNSSNWGRITDIRYQCKVELYRAPLPSTLNTTGWTQYETLDHVLNDVKNNNGTLT